MGVGEAVSNAKSLEKAAEELALISGQKPLITKAKINRRLPVFVKVLRSVQSYPSW